MDEPNIRLLAPAEACSIGRPGCISEGDTRDEALANVQEAIQLYLEPVDDDAIVSRIPCRR